jgi:hypothetical protein
MKRWPPTIAAGCGHTAAVRRDGTVVAIGHDGCGECDVSGWRNAQAVVASSVHMATNTGNAHTVGFDSTAP